MIGTYLAGKKPIPPRLTCSPDVEQCVQILEIANQTMLGLDEGNDTVQRCADYIYHLIQFINVPGTFIVSL